MFKKIFLQIHQTLEQINQGFDNINNIDDELSLLEKYLSIKETSEILTEDLRILNLKLNKMEKKYGLLDIYPDDISTKDQVLNFELNEDILPEQKKDEDGVIELFEEDLMTFQKGIGFYDLSIYDKAIINLDNIVEKYPDFDLARLYTAMAYLKRKEYNKARQEVEALFKFSDDVVIQSLAHNILGIIYGNQLEYEEAILHFQQAIDLKGDWKEPIYNLAIIYYKLNHFSEAIMLFEELYSVNPRDWETMLYLGKSYQKIKEYDKANWYFDEIYAITKNPTIIKQIASHYEKHYQFQKAIYWYNKWLIVEPKQSIAFLGLAKNMWLKGDKKTAITIIKKALVLEEDSIEILLIYAWMLTETNPIKARLVLQKISEHLYKNKLESFELYLAATLARLYYLNDDKNNSDKFSEMLQNTDNNSLKSLGNFVLGLINLDEKNPKQALVNFENSITGGIKFPYLDFYIGYSHYLLGNVEEAKITWGNLLKQ
ncbi:MAG: tetratricopeptide repeat protein [Vulcanibacillus sp.]